GVQPLIIELLTSLMEVVTVPDFRTVILLNVVWLELGVMNFHFGLSGKEAASFSMCITTMEP
ncbi:MAG TPA: hypothetical protein PLU80_23895, partial [Acidobacteriota bacterium]|nr:hypothetical protein [Acidobacteriota bacterium]